MVRQKDNKKRGAVLLLALGMAISLAGCGKGENLFDAAGGSEAGADRVV